MHKQKNSHPYFRVSSREGDDSLSLLGRRVRSGSRVLDVGAGQGALGKLLVDCKVDGIDSSEEAAQKAKVHYCNYYINDLNSEDLPSGVKNTRYDIIVCADVLEHLFNPQKLLEQAKVLLNPQGILLVSLPNVAYAGVIADLLCERFDYTETGILDRTHLHFYTRSSACQLLCNAGFFIHWLDSVQLDLRSTEFSHHLLDTFPPALSKALLGRKDALDYQILIEARLEESTALVKEYPLAKDVSMQFYCECYWRGIDNSFTQDRCISSYAIIGELKQMVSFRIPSSNEPLQQIRFDPADRIGIINIFDVKIFNTEEECLWTWDRLSLSSSHQILLFSEHDHAKVVLTGDDPQLVFPVLNNNILQTNIVIQVVLSWPSSTDYRSLFGHINQLEQQHQIELDQLNQLLEKEVSHSRILEANLRKIELFGFWDWLRWHINIGKQGQ